MHRELNPELFGTRGAVEKTPASQEAAPGAGTYLPGEIRAAQAQITALKNQLQAAERRTEALVAQFQEFMRSNATRFERVSQAMMRLEENQAQVTQELATKVAAVASRINERKVTDAKIQDLIDRHNIIVRNFENRLTHLQRVLSEQEMQLHNSNAALEDARQEIMRIKGR